MIPSKGSSRRMTRVGRMTCRNITPPHPRRKGRGCEGSIRSCRNLKLEKKAPIPLQLETPRSRILLTSSISIDQPSSLIYRFVTLSIRQDFETVIVSPNFWPLAGKMSISTWLSKVQILAKHARASAGQRRCRRNAVPRCLHTNLLCTRRGTCLPYHLATHIKIWGFLNGWEVNCIYIL